MYTLIILILSLFLSLSSADAAVDQTHTILAHVQQQQRLNFKKSGGRYGYLEAHDPFFA
jgi:hypothetical protein